MRATNDQTGGVQTPDRLLDSLTARTRSLRRYGRSATQSIAVRSAVTTALGMVVTLLFDISITHAGTNSELDRSYPVLIGVIFVATTVQESWFLAALVRERQARSVGGFDIALGASSFLIGLVVCKQLGLTVSESAAILAAILALAIAVPLQWVRAGALREGSVLFGVGIRYVPPLAGLIGGRLIGSTYVGHLVGFAVGCVGTLAVLTYFARGTRFEAPRSRWSDGGFLVAASSVLAITVPTDLFFATTLGSGNRAIYTVASRFATAAVAAVVTPLSMGLSAWLARSPERRNRPEKKLLATTAALGTVAVFPLAVMAPIVIEWLLRDSGVQHQLGTVVDVARIFCLLLPVQLVGTFASRILIAREQQQRLFLVATTTLLVNGVLDWTMSNTFGVRGLAWSSVAAWSTSAILLSAASLRGTRPWSRFMLSRR